MNTNHHKPRERLNLLRLFCKLSARQEKGTALVTAMGFGLLLILLGSVAIVRSSNEKVNSAANAASRQSLAITDAGINNLIGQLTKDSTRGLLLRSFDPNGVLGTAIDEWTDTSIDLTLSGGVNSCTATADEAADELETITVDSVSGNVTINDVPVGAGDASGTYKIVAYRYSDPDGVADSGDESGTLVVDGKLTKQSDSQSRIQVEFPVTIELAGGAGPAPALMATNFNIQQSDAFAEGVVCTDPTNCSLDCSANGTSDNADQGDLEAALGATSNGQISSNETSQESEIQIGVTEIPDIPAVPTSCTGTITDIGTVSSDTTLPDDAGTSCSVDINGDGTNETVYYYQLTGINSSAVLFSDTSAEYRLYINGPIDQFGNDDIRLTDSTITSSPGQIRMYGGSTNGTHAPDGTQWMLSGNACTMAFIHAPTVDVGIDGGGNGCSDIGTDDAVADATEIFGAGTYSFSDPNNTNIYGAVWSKTYNIIGNPSNSSVFYEQPGLIEVLNAEGFGSIGFDTIKASSITNRERSAVN